MMLRCMLNKRKDNRRLKKHEDEIRRVTERVIQDTIKSHNTVFADLALAKDLAAPEKKVTVKSLEPV